MSQGQTTDAQNSIPRHPAWLIFTRENGLLGDHPITLGPRPFRADQPRGHLLRPVAVGPRGSVPLTACSPTRRLTGPCRTMRWSRPPVVARAWRSFMARAASSCSARPGSSRRSSWPTGQPFGMNDPGNDNRQLSLNIMHWLSGPTTVNPRTAKKAAASRRAAASRKAGRGTPKPAKAQEPQADPPVDNP